MAPENTADILEEMDDEDAAEIANRMETGQLVEIVDNMEPDEAADLLGDIPRPRPRKFSPRSMIRMRSAFTGAPRRNCRRCDDLSGCHDRAGYDR